MHLVISFLFIALIFFSCHNPSKDNIELKPEEETVFFERGEAIVKEAFDTLLNNLSRALQETGIQGAVKFCNLHAYPIIYYLEKQNNVKIKRASVKLRNPANHPDSLELSALEYYEKLKSEGKNLKPIVKRLDDYVHFFKPIIIQQRCVICHGTVGGELKLENYQIISELYPLDNATGYKVGDLRGIWHIKMQYHIP